MKFEIDVQVEDLTNLRLDELEVIKNQIVCDNLKISDDLIYSNRLFNMVVSEIENRQRQAA